MRKPCLQPSTDATRKRDFGKRMRRVPNLSTSRNVAARMKHGCRYWRKHMPRRTGISALSREASQGEYPDI